MHNHRDTALGGKADVDGLLAGFNSVNDSLADLEDRLQDNMVLMESLNNSLTKAKDQLTPAEKALDDVSTLIKPMKPQLDTLKDLLQNGGQQVEGAQENAEKAGKEATAGNQDLLTLEKQLGHLQNATREDGETEPVGDRLKKLQQDARTLANITEEIVQDLEGKANSIQTLQGEILQKSTKLEGLDAKLKKLLTELRTKAKTLSTCK